MFMKNKMKLKMCKLENIKLSESKVPKNVLSQVHSSSPTTAAIKAARTTGIMKMRMNQ